MKGMNPGPTVFMNNAPQLYAVFIVFFLANLLMIPFGWAAIKAAKQILQVPRGILMPIILLFCVVGSFAINNTPFGVALILVFGVTAYFMESNGIPVAPAILGMVLGALLEDTFISSMIKVDGDLVAFLFGRPIAATLGVVTMLIWFSPLLIRTMRRWQGSPA